MQQVKLFGSSRSRPSSRPPRRRKPRSGLKTLTIILIVLAVLEGLYFLCVYSDIPFIAKWRSIYIQTAMDTMNHQWLATAFIPRSVIDEAMALRGQAQQEQTEHSSAGDWAGEGPESVDVSGEEDFYTGFVGWNAAEHVSNGSPVDAIAGATVSSNAVYTAVNAAIDCYNNELKGVA